MCVTGMNDDAVNIVLYIYICVCIGIRVYFTKGFGLIKKMKITLVKTRNDRSLVRAPLRTPCGRRRMLFLLSMRLYRYIQCTLDLLTGGDVATTYLSYAFNFFIM